MADIGLLVTVIIFSIIFAWIIVFSILAVAIKKPALVKLSIIGPLGNWIYTKGMRFESESLNMAKQAAKENRINYRLLKDQEKLNRLKSQESTKTQGGYYNYYGDTIDPDF